MRVVRVITRPNRGGPLRQLCALVPALARLGVVGPVWTGEVEPHERDGAADLERLGVEVVRVPDLVRGLSPRRDRRAARFLRERLRAQRPDVVHTHTFKAGALGRRAAHDAGVPVVVHTFHGHHLRAPWPVRAYARATERALARFTTVGVCLSESQRRDVVEAGVLAADRARVVGPGLDVAALRAAASPDAVAAVRAACAPDGPLVAWVGRLVGVKDPDLALATFAALRARVPGARLALVGDGPLRRRVERRARSTDGVRVFGALDETAPVVAAADVLLLTSRREGTPITLVEARVLGTRVVATAVGGVADLLAGDAGGEAVASRDPHALAAALADALAGAGERGGRADLAASGPASAEARFGAERLARETAALYREALGSVGRSA